MKLRCKKEEFVKDKLFHIYNHSVYEIDLFYEEDDYHYFLSKLKKNFKSCELGIFSYCLMPNHFHFCVKQKSDKPIYEIFNKFLTSYALHFNHKYKRKGKVFCGKLQHKKINNDEYLLKICSYIHLNPLKAGLVKDLCKWKFSNYLEWIGEREGVLFDDELLKDNFESHNYYRELIEYKEKEFNEIEDYLFSIPNKAPKDKKDSTL